jgi:hypothetical protein
VQNSTCGVYTNLVRDIATSAPNISTFNFKMGDMEGEDLAGLEHYLGPLLFSPRLEHLHLDFPTWNRESQRWWYIALEDLYLLLPSALTHLKSISVVTEVSQAGSEYC